MMRLLGRLGLATASGVTLTTAGFMLRQSAVEPRLLLRLIVGFGASWLLTAVVVMLGDGVSFGQALRGRGAANGATERLLRNAALAALCGSLLLVLAALVIPAAVQTGLLARFSPESFPGGADDVPLRAARYLAISLAFGWTMLCTAALAIAAAAHGWRARGLAPAQALATVAAVYGAVTLWTAQVQSLTGDEPHYLLAARSLLEDGDLDLANDYADREYRPFWPTDTLRRSLVTAARRRLDPHAVPLEGNLLRPVHQIGLSLLLLPGFALAGWIGAVVTALVIGLLAAWQAVRLTVELADEASGWLAAAVVAFGSPLLAYAASLHTEPAAALAYGYLAWLAVGGRGPRWPAVLALFALPWLHWKYVPVGLLLAVFISRDARRYREPSWPLWLGLAAGVVTQLLVYLALYGTLRPDAPQVLSGGRFPSLFSGNPLVGAAGLLVDQQDGLFVAWPLGLLLVPGLVLMCCEAAYQRLLAAVLLHFALIASYTAWGSGYAPAGRQLLPVVPLLGPFVAAGCRLLAGRPVLRVLCWLNGLLVAGGVLLPRLRYPAAGEAVRQPVLALADSSLLDLLAPAVRDGGPALAVAWAYVLLLAAWGLIVAQRGYGTLRRREKGGGAR